MKVDELVALGGIAPPVPTAAPAREAIEEVTKIYYEVYVPGLCQFFESQWYNFKSQGSNSIAIFLNNKTVISLFADFLNALNNVSKGDPGQIAYSSNLETRIVWALTTLAYSISPGINTPRDDPLPNDDATELRGRLVVFDTLLSGNSLSFNPLMPTPKNADAHQRKEYDFWFCLAEFLGQQDPRERDRYLTKIRTLLDGRENRDLLYSIAIARELAPRFGPGYENKVPDHLDEREPRNKFHVATQFIKSELTATGGTTNIVRRFALIAAKAFINPGVNVNRNRS